MVFEMQSSNCPTKDLMRKGGLLLVLLHDHLLLQGKQAIVSGLQVLHVVVQE